MSVEIPASLAAHADEEHWSGWLRGLPRLVDELLREWELTVDGTAVAGSAALVVPVVGRDRTPAALKVGWPHWEAEHEHLALRYWNGHGAVRLLRADPRRFALLLERASSRSLLSVSHDEAITLIAGLYRQLHRVQPPPQLRRLSDLADEWAERMPRLIADGRVPRRLVEHALSRARDLSGDVRTDGTLIHTDLNSANVLLGSRDGRDEWLAIDPEPLNGDPAFEAAPLLGERWDELPRDRVREVLAGRLWVLGEATGWDEERVRGWALVREAVALLQRVEDGTLESGRLDRGVQFLKGMQR